MNENLIDLSNSADYIELILISLISMCLIIITLCFSGRLGHTYLLINDYYQIATYKNVLVEFLN